jgi:STE24 endopeptidase
VSAPPRIDPERMRRARAFRAFTLWIGVASTAAGIGAMVALHVLGAGVAARDLSARWILAPDTFGVLEDPPFIYLVIVLFGLIGWVVQLPFAYAAWARGTREGLVVQSLASAFADRLKALILTLVLIGIPVTAWYLILPRPDWWLLTIAGVAVLSALGMLLGPALTGLFFRFEPLADATVADRVRAVAERAGVRVSGVYRLMLGAKTTAANAAVIGIGPTKRIALGDTLLGKFPIDEVESVVAHEVGHDVSGDPPRYVVALTIAGSAAVIAVRLVVDAVTGGIVVPEDGVADPASYPLVAAAFGAIGFVSRPAFLAFTRWRERAADAFGARHTSPESMARALVRLADQNLADPEPPRWEELFFYSHPAIANRVRALGLRWEQFAAG